MPRFRKRPVVVEAIQWTGEQSNIRDLKKFCPEIQFHPFITLVSGTAVTDFEFGSPMLRIMTLEGNHWAQLNDWILKGVKGEFYPCKPDIFEATYEPE